MEEEFIKAIYLTKQNGQDLFDDAKILLEQKRLPRAFSLFHLSFEECGRFAMIYDIIFRYSIGEIKPNQLNFKRLVELGYDKHENKVEASFKYIRTMAITFYMIKNGITPPKPGENMANPVLNQIHFEVEFMKNKEKDLSGLKNKGLYITYSTNKFHLPYELISEKNVDHILSLSEMTNQLMDDVINFTEHNGGFKKMISSIRSRKGRF